MIDCFGYLLFLPVLGMFLRCMCCGPSCDIFSDDFGDGTITGLTQVSGTWSESGGSVSTSSSSAILLCDTPHPDGEANVRIETEATVSTSGDSVRVILNYSDSSNYWFVEVKCGTGAYIKIFQRASGSNTEKSSKTITLATGTHIICASVVDSSALIATVGDHVISWGGTFSEPEFGLGSGTNTGSVSFTSITAEKTSEDCATQCSDDNECTNCVAMDRVIKWKMVIAGIPSTPTGVGIEPCDEHDCDDINGTYYISGFYGEVTISGSSGCMWWQEYPNAPCGLSKWGTFVHVKSTGPTANRIIDAGHAWSITSGKESFPNKPADWLTNEFTKVYSTSDISCHTLTNEALSGATLANRLCRVNTGATCEITALSV